MKATPTAEHLALLASGLPVALQVARRVSSRPNFRSENALRPPSASRLRLHDRRGFKVNKVFSICWSRCMVTGTCR